MLRLQGRPLEDGEMTPLAQTPKAEAPPLKKSLELPPPDSFRNKVVLWVLPLDLQVLWVCFQGSQARMEV